ncbi:hypothetical protein J5N97_008999 [Dioscorea zingiberensis]|uniref:Uncharacterized protein n=1 Tax=Dioscorea zingiberensis TaxID=325984 RepID=A0A9D5CXH1_9LILI|nr:hypothetical protein J5N97_008999 [Dioscorea zingiberensis]
MDYDFNAAEVLEFVLREPIEDWLANLLFLAIPISSPLSPCLVRTMLIRRLASDLSFRSISERSLQSLEYLNNLHHRNDPSYSLRDAYCAVAVECTASFLRSRDDDGEFFSAVKRIWNCRMEDLVTAEETAGLVWYGLKRAGREMEQAVVDSRVRDALKKRDTKMEALEALRVYLREETLKMGPPFLVILADSIGESENSVIDPPLVELKEQDSEALAEGGVSGTKINPLPSPEVSMVKERLRASCLDLQRVVRDPLPDAVALATNIYREMPANMVAEGEGSIRDGNGIESTNDAGSDLGGSGNTDDHHDVDEADDDVVVAAATTVEMVAEVLPAEMMNSKQEDYPVVSSIEEDDHDDDADITTNDKGNEAVPQPDVVDPNVSHLRVDKGKGKIGDVSGGSRKRDNTKVTMNDVPAQKRSMMDWNPTAKTYEWDDKSGDSSSNESQGLLKKPHLPSSKKRPVSPLKIQENSGFAGRRKKLRWTPLEEDTLRNAVKRHGKGSWKFIKSCHPEIFENRTEVDLKDKWRNLTRN